MRIVFAILILSLSACSTVSVQMQDKTRKGEFRQPTKQYTAWFVLYGIAQRHNVNAVEICGGADKVVRVNSFIRPIDVIVSGLTYGLISSMTIRVYCVPENDK